MKTTFLITSLLLTSVTAFAQGVTADLVVTNIVAPANALEGDPIDISWTVANNGQANAGGAWTDVVYLKRVDIPNGPVTTLGQFTYDKGLAAGTIYTRTERFQLPAKIQGIYEVVVATNTGKSVFEFGNAANNDSLDDDQVLAIGLKPRPDLQVSSATIPDRVSAGGTAAVRFTVINQGTVATNVPHWKDNVYLSLDNKLTGDDILVGSYDNGAALDPG
jgi:hypothetical protein